jgi:aspartate aminotransferase
MKLSRIANETQTPPILRVAAEINEKIARGERFYNFTVGDFDSRIFPIPQGLEDAIVASYRDHQTNYPGAVGLPQLRDGVKRLIERYAGIEYAVDEIQISSGSRPLIYSMYRSVLDPGDTVVFPVPSWMNDLYCHLCSARGVSVNTDPKANFMPTAEQMEPFIKDAAMLALCSPQNPTGTVFAPDQLREICEMVVAENRRRPPEAKPLYVMFDQVYWLLAFEGTAYPHPVKLCPEIRDYLFCADGLSKSFAGTGVRVGWGCGPRHLIRSVSDILAYMGAWAPRPEQVATGKFLEDLDTVEDYLGNFRQSLHQRLHAIYEGFMSMKSSGLEVDAIAPQAGIYLTVRINLEGKRTEAGETLANSEQALRYLLDEARVGILPFSFFGAADKGQWYRISVGTCALESIPELLQSLENALLRLS